MRKTVPSCTQAPAQLHLNSSLRRRSSAPKRPATYLTAAARCAMVGATFMLAESLQKIVEQTPGAAGAILMGFDGIAVMQHLAPGCEDVDIESAAMEFSFRFVELRQAAASLNMGEVTDITIKAEHQAVLCRVLSDEYFVSILLTDPSHLGKGRWVLRSTSGELCAEL